MLIAKSILYFILAGLCEIGGGYNYVRNRRVAQLAERCLDTAEVWGSSPHAPTNEFNISATISPTSVTPDYALRDSHPSPYI